MDDDYEQAKAGRSELHEELSKDNSSIVYVEDAKHTEYYDENLDIWFCKFCEQQT